MKKYCDYEECPYYEDCDGMEMETNNSIKYIICLAVGVLIGFIFG